MRVAGIGFDDDVALRDAEQDEEVSHLRAERHEIHLRFGQRFFHELFRPTRWAADAITPMEKIRVLDPVPVTDSFATARTRFTSLWQKVIKPVAPHARLEQWLSPDLRLHGCREISRASQAAAACMNF